MELRASVGSMLLLLLSLLLLLLKWLSQFVNDWGIMLLVCVITGCC